MQFKVCISNYMVQPVVRISQETLHFQSVHLEVNAKQDPSSLVGLINGLGWITARLTTACSVFTAHVRVKIIFY